MIQHLNKGLARLFLLQNTVHKWVIKEFKKQKRLLQKDLQKTCSNIHLVKAQSTEQESIGSQSTRIPRRGLEEGRGKDTSIYMSQVSKRVPD